MTARLIDGKALAASIRASLAPRIARARDAGEAPGLAVVLVGEDPASAVYVRNKIQACEDVGIRSFDYRLPADTSEAELLARIAQLNADPAVHGILVQLPLPRHIDAQRIVEVDCLRQGRRRTARHQRGPDVDGRAALSLVHTLRRDENA